MFGETLLVGCIGLERNIFRFVHIVLTQNINLILIAIFDWSWFDIGRVVATLKHIWIIFFLSYFGNRWILTLRDWVCFEGGLIGCFCLQLEFWFIGVVGVGTAAVILSHIEQ